MENGKGHQSSSPPASCLRIAVSGFAVMHGRPGAVQQPEHEHPEIQIATYFRKINSRASIAADALPEYFSLIPSCKPHHGSRNEGAEVIVVHLEPRELDRGADELLRKPAAAFRSLDFAIDPVIHSMSSALRREFLARRDPDRLFVEAIGTVIVGHLLRQQAFRWSERSIKGKLSPQSLRNTLDLIENQLPGELTVATLAHNLSIGVHQFTRLFRNAVGQSPYQYIVKRRIERAQDLLEQTEMAPAEIALELGFSSQSHLTFVFRKHTRQTPQAYRRMRRSVDKRIWLPSQRAFED